MANLDFITEEDRDSFFSMSELLSPGWKTFVITDDEDKFTQNALKLAEDEGREPRISDGQQWVITVECIRSPVPSEIGGTFKQGFNIHNPSDKAQKISRAAVGKLIFDGICKPEGRKDPKLLHGIPFDAKVNQKEYENASGEKKKKNELSDFAKAGTRLKAMPAKTQQSADFGFQEEGENWLNE